MLMLLGSVLVNVVFYARYQEYFTSGNDPIEKFHSGEIRAADKIAIIRVQGVIMPPLTERVLKQIKLAKEDDTVKGVLLTIDSPGGFVADSHQIYHRLQELSTGDDKKTVYVAMKRLAASGGYYIAMGAGPDAKIFAEPTTWTGSIGVIIPRYDVSGLAQTWNIKSVPLKTGKFKDALSPFRAITPEEQQLWGGILNESFEQFLTVISENRKSLAMKKTEQPTAADDPSVVVNHWELVSENANAKEKGNLATGRIFTASVAASTGLIDEVAFEDEALEQLKKQLQLAEVRVVTYHSPTSLFEMLLGFGKANDPEQQQQRATFDSTVPQAMYYFSWVPPAIPVP